MPGPMEGVRVLDMSQVISGPMAASWLADQGAEVIKVEDPELGDIARWLGPRKNDLSSMFLTANRGKKSIVLDLKTKPEHRDALTKLIMWADVLIQNFRPGAIERLGFGYETAMKLNARLIYCSLSGYGPTGPYAKGRVYDPIIQASSGTASTQRDAATGEPVLIQTLVCDKVSALTAAQAITAALYAREKTGKGQHIELAMLDAAIAFLWPEGMYNYTFIDETMPPQPEFGSFYRLWKTKDGYFAMAGVQDKEFQAQCKGLGRPDLAEDPRFKDITGRMTNAAAFREEMAAAIGAMTSADFMDRMIAEGAPAAKVNERHELMSDPQVKVNGTIIEYAHGSEGRVRGPRHPARFHGTPVGAPGLAPHLGQHTEDILKSLT